MEHLKLSRVTFLDDAADDPESQYYEINETGKKQKFSTQTTKTIEAFWQKYHTKLDDDYDDVQAITPEFTKALDDFITKSFAKWKWLSNEDHKADMNVWADKMKQKDCSLEKGAYIKRLIKGMNWKELISQVSSVMKIPDLFYVLPRCS
jgi:hypothetical protein